MTFSEGTAHKVAETNDKKERKKLLKDAWKMFNRSIKSLEYAQKVDRLASEAEVEWVKIRDEKSIKVQAKHGLQQTSPHVSVDIDQPLSESA